MTIQENDHREWLGTNVALGGRLVIREGQVRRMLDRSWDKSWDRAVVVANDAATTEMSKDEDNGDDESDGKTGVVTKTRPKTKKPSLYKVLLLNDDYTPMEFVVHVLEKYFNKGREDATRIMLQVHQKGVGVCGVYTYEVAETKVTQVIDFSRQHGHPLQCTMEKE